MALASFSCLTACKNEEQKEATQQLLTEEKTKEKYDQIKEFDWLIGRWEGSSGKSNTTEVWVKNNDSTLYASSYTIRDTDTIISENMVLDQRADSLYLVITAKNQNDNKPITFTLTGFAANKYIFENPEHDFPTRIIYNKINDDSLLAEVSGPIDGKTTILEFPMAKK